MMNSFRLVIMILGIMSFVLFRTTWTLDFIAGVLVPQAFAEEKHSDAYKLETITVTTDKREQNIQEVPAPITAFTETDLEDAGVEDIDDVINLVPNMTFGTSFLGDEAIFRGIRLSQLTFKNPVVYTPTDPKIYLESCCSVQA